MAGVNVIPLVDEGLGNSAYLVDLTDGRALAVDASRDLRGLRAAAERRGLTLAYAADTHLHADFLTGAVAFAASDGSRVMGAASLLTRAGYRDVTVLEGGPQDWTGWTGRSLEVTQ
ncbi:MAG: hypothetical protein ACXVGN_10445 [Mycobacteriaceae bacterium]